MGVHKSLSIGLGLVGTFTFAAVALADNPPSEQPNFPPTTNKTEAVVDIPEKLPLFDIEELRSAMMERYLRVKNSVSVTEFETQPVSFGDERREPRPEPPLPPYKNSAPDWRCDNWMDTAEEVGWPLEELPKLSYVIYRESRCDPEAHNADDPAGGSSGLMQLNRYFCKRSRYHENGYFIDNGILDECDDLFDPQLNLEAALFLWENSGWGPWGMSN